MQTQDVFDQMLQRWNSPVVPAAKIVDFSGGLVSGKTFANLRCKGEPIPESLMVGRRRAYIATSVIEWLRSRTKGGIQ